MELKFDVLGGVKIWHTWYCQKARKACSLLVQKKEIEKKTIFLFIGSSRILGADLK